MIVFPNFSPRPPLPPASLAPAEKPLATPPTNFATFAPAIIAKIGAKPAKDFKNPNKLLVSVKNVCVRNFKTLLSAKEETNSFHASLVLISCTATEACAFSASLAVEPELFCATLYASCALANSCNNGITLPTCLTPPSCSTI